jgi:hypothetical protein
VLDILFAVIGFAVLIAIMAIGVLMGKKPIAGSCGGVAAALGEDDYTCEICGDDPKKCDEISNTSNPAFTNAAELKK